MAQQYSIEEVKAHNSASDIWMIIHDKVYDVTKFVTEHPGGEEVMLEYAGKEATTEFDDVGHSTDAKELMKKYLIGELREEDRKKKASKTATPSQCKTIIAAVSAVAAGFGAVVLYKSLQAARASK